MWEMVEAGELSGTVPAAIAEESGRQIFFGIEDQGLFEKEVQLYLKNLKDKNVTLEKLKRLREKLQQEKK